MNIRRSLYRHVFGQTAKKDQCFENLRPSKSSDCQFKANGSFFAVTWDAVGAGQVAVFPHTAVGRLFGYVVLFAAAFPLAAILSVVSNVIEVRSDLFKFLYTARRPMPVRVSHIDSTWNTVMKVIAWAAIPSNLFLMAFGSHQLDQLLPNLIHDAGVGSGHVRNVSLLYVVLAGEHVLVLAVALLWAIIPMGSPLTTPPQRAPTSLDLDTGATISPRIAIPQPDNASGVTHARVRTPSKGKAGPRQRRRKATEDPLDQTLQYS